MTNTSTIVTIDTLNSIFATYALPVTLVSDNGTTFTSDSFKANRRENGIKYITSAPRHQATNGLPEKAVQTFKTSMTKMSDSLQWNAHINKFLFQYRNTPRSTPQ